MGMKNPTISQLKKKAWKVFSLWIRTRSPVCFTCGFRADPKGLQAGHYIPKSIANSLYFSEINVQTQCMRCNLWLLGNSDEFGLRLQKKYGEDVLEKLRTEKRKLKQWDRKELEFLIKKYE